MVGKEEMEEILEDFEQGGSGYVVLDVRNPDEVEKTGKLSPNVITCPLPDLKDALQMDSEKFESTYGSPKPSPDDTIVLTCAAGKRLVLATTLYSCPIAQTKTHIFCFVYSAQMAAEMVKDEYPKCVVYTGGAKEWFE